MNELEQKTISSVEVAEMVGKEHSKLLRDIRNYIEQLAEAKIGSGDFLRKASTKMQTIRKDPATWSQRKAASS